MTTRPSPTRPSPAPRGYSLVDLAIGVVLVGSMVFAVARWYAGIDCSNVNVEAERMLPRLLSLTMERERTVKSRVEVTDCGFTSRGARGDCQRVGLSSNAPTQFTYVATPNGATTKAYAIGQTPATYGSVVSLEPNQKIDKSAARCR
jgi:hypothetical protein